MVEVTIRLLMDDLKEVESLKTLLEGLSSVDVNFEVRADITYGELRQLVVGPDSSPFFQVALGEHHTENRRYVRANRVLSVDPRHVWFLESVKPNLDGETYTVTWMAWSPDGVRKRFESV